MPGGGVEFEDTADADPAEKGKPAQCPGRRPVDPVHGGVGDDEAKDGKQANQKLRQAEHQQFLTRRTSPDEIGAACTREEDGAVDLGVKSIDRPWLEATECQGK